MISLGKALVLHLCGYILVIFSHIPLGQKIQCIWHCKSLNLWFLDHSSCEIITIIWGITGQMCFSIRPSLRNHCALSDTSMKKMQ